MLMRSGNGVGRVTWWNHVLSGEKKSQSSLLPQQEGCWQEIRRGFSGDSWTAGLELPLPCLQAVRNRFPHSLNTSPEQHSIMQLKLIKVLSCQRRRVPWARGVRGQHRKVVVKVWMKQFLDSKF